MLRQYHAQRRRGGDNPHGVGTLSIGDTFYLQDGVRPMGGLPRYHEVIRRDPWMIVAFHNRQYHTGRRTTYMSGGHTATVRSLRTGREVEVADWFLLAHDCDGLDCQKAEGVPLPLPDANPQRKARLAA